MNPNVIFEGGGYENHLRTGGGQKSESFANVIHEWPLSILYSVWIEFKHILSQTTSHKCSSLIISAMSFHFSCETLLY